MTSKDKQITSGETKDSGVTLTKEQARNALVFLERSTLQGKETPAFNSLVKVLQDGLA